MQIDFHHAVTYLVARLAGFSAKDAGVIGYSAQYVDDATNSGKIRFTNGAMYSRISSAHKMIDHRNFKALGNLQVWLPFHFLPGNGGKKAGDNPNGTFIQKLVCKPESYIANDMISCCIGDSGKPYGLHRLGITLHVLADTFSHQGFAGVNHEINKVEGLNNDIKLFPQRTFKDYLRSIQSLFIDQVLPLGHGAALSCPDLPFLTWKYKNGLGQEIVRDNQPVYLEAVKSMYQCCVKFMNQSNTLPDHHLQMKENDLNLIKQNIKSFRDEEGSIRHDKWVKDILSGKYSFNLEGDEKIGYIHKGENSWKYIALDTKKEVDRLKEKYKYTPGFLKSDWKLFHDALQKHRLEVLHDVLPKYGICGA